MNDIDVPSTPTERQAAYLRYLASRAHGAGMPHLDIAGFTRRQAADWIDYLQLVVTAEERVRETLERARMAAEDSSAPYLRTPPSDHLPRMYQRPWQELPPAEDHEHLVGSVTREDGVEEAVCVLCGASA